MAVMENRLRQLREAKKLTQGELASRIGTTGDQISRLESGERRLTVNWLSRLERGLECDGVEILGGVKLSPRERRWLDYFQSMSEFEQHRWLRALAALQNDPPGGEPANANHAS